MDTIKRYTKRASDRLPDYERRTWIVLFLILSVGLGSGLVVASSDCLSGYTIVGTGATVDCSSSTTLNDNQSIHIGKLTTYADVRGVITNQSRLQNDDNVSVSSWIYNSGTSNGDPGLMVYTNTSKNQYGVVVLHRIMEGSTTQATVRYYERGSPSASSTNVGLVDEINTPYDQGDFVHQWYQMKVNASDSSSINVYIRFDANNAWNDVGTLTGGSFTEGGVGLGKLSIGTRGVDTYYDSDVAIAGDGNTLAGTVRDDDNNELSNVDITVETQSGSEFASGTSKVNGEYAISAPFKDGKTYTIRATKSGYQSASKTITWSGETQTVDFTLTNESSALSVTTDPHLGHADTAPYHVEFTDSSGRYNVTTEATVVSNNTTVLTIDSANNRVVATSDTSVQDLTYIRAEYTYNSTTYTDTYAVTVANLSVRNINILPPLERFTASIEDATVQVIIIGTGIAVAASIAASVFAGLAAFPLVIIIAWFAGYVGTGVMLVSVITSVMIGLNVAESVDFTRFRG